jgi:hypothetical protein
MLVYFIFFIALLLLTIFLAVLFNFHIKAGIKELSVKVFIIRMIKLGALRTIPRIALMVSIIFMLDCDIYKIGLFMIILLGTLCIPLGSYYFCTRMATKFEMKKFKTTRR